MKAAPAQVFDAHTKSSGLILDTPGCKIPKFDPYDKSVKLLIKEKEPYTCGGDPVFMITLPNSTIVLNETILKTAYNVTPKSISCFYTAINQTADTKFFFEEPKRLRFGVPLDEEFLKVQCKVGNKTFNQYIALVPLKEEVEKRTLKTQRNDADALNVILIGIDSVSKLNFLRHFKRTHRFLVSNMHAFDMRGYTKVADNTFPNLTPMLTGHFVEHYWNESLKNMFFDHLDLIWKDYSKMGYRTFYTEDSAWSGTFNYLKNGFQKPPTDYYFRPLALAIDESSFKEENPGYCLNDQLETNILYGYLKDFVKTMSFRPYFAFVMVSTLTHDSLNAAGYADEPTYNLLTDLWKSGAMNKSIVVTFSDHGIRFGKIRETYIGKFEERMPFMYISMPKWFLEKHGDLARNLKINENRLITLFDIHATLYHLLHFSTGIPPEIKSKVTQGDSLFNEISEYRTCGLANILPHWCPCQVYKSVPLDDRTVIRAASAAMRDINKQLKPYEGVCAHMKVDQITDARTGEANDLVSRFIRHDNVVVDRKVVYGDKVNPLLDYLITVRASPGGGMFEFTLRHHAKSRIFQVLGISRINAYGTQSHCINKQSLKKFCFCK